MKKLLAAINSKYIHTNPAVRSLKAYAGDPDTELCEFTINEHCDDILRRIYERHADAVCFSCYIWNIGHVTKICRLLRAVSPSVILVLGGPEVSYDAEKYLTDGIADAVIRGEGELSFKALCKNGFDFSETNGVSFIIDGAVIHNPDMPPVDMDTLPFPYTDDELKAPGRLFYYETSRGCPYRCSYCISSLEKKLRYKSVEKVTAELMRFINAGVPLVKLTDRTFNSSPARAKKIVRFLTEHGKNTSFHFEIAAHTMDAGLLKLFRDAPRGRFQLEIGVQTTNPEALEAIERRTDFSKIASAVRSVKRGGSVPLHLDLIAGLPYEDAQSFRRSFNDVYALRPDELQLGFLKLLKGTAIRAAAAEHGYIYEPEPVYEVLSNKYISFDELNTLKGMAYVLDKYYNSGAFSYTLSYLESVSSSAYDMYLDLYEYFRMRGKYGVSLSRASLYSILYDYGKHINASALFFDCIKFDFLAHNHAQTLPFEGTLADEDFFRSRFEFIDNNREKYFAGCDGMSAKEIAKHTVFAQFGHDVTGSGKKADILAVFRNDGSYHVIRREKEYFVYMMRCADNSLYTGMTTDIRRRASEHMGKGKKSAKYTARHTAVKLEAAWRVSSRSDALKLEYFIKQLTKRQKESICADPMTLAGICPGTLPGIKPVPENTDPQ